MHNETYDKISTSPLFQSLVKQRNRFSLILSIITLGVYYTFVLFASTNPAGFATPVAEGSKWPIGLVVGWGIQAFAFIMTGVYVSRANSEFDTMAQNVISEAGR